MWIVQLTTTRPEKQTKGAWGIIYTTPEKIKVEYLGNTCYTRLQGVRLFETYAGAAIAMNKCIDDFNQYLKEQFEHHSNDREDRKSLQLYVDALEEKRKSRKYEIVDLSTFPKSTEFDEAFPFNSNHIPEDDHDVEFIYRDDTKLGVTTNFLRQEMLKGRFLTLCPEHVRWRYIPDSYFLQMKKQGYHTA